MKKLNLLSIFVFFATYQLVQGQTLITPTGLCINNCQEPTSSISATLFPGTNLKFYPGFLVMDSSRASAAELEARWLQLFSGSRKESYRPPGVYGGIVRRSKWKQFYVDQTKRPADPTDYNDPNYDWSRLDDVFNLNVVQNEGALVAIGAGEVSYSGWPIAPAWLANSTYNGTFIAGTDGGSGKDKIIPAYWRYKGPDNRGRTNVNIGPNRPPIVEEYLAFHQAMHNYLVAKGYIDKVMFVTLAEFYVSHDAQRPADYNYIDFLHGVGTRSKAIAEIWAQSQIPVTMSSLTGSTTDRRRNILWQYMDDFPLAMTFPDMKMNGTNNISGDNTVEIGGVYQTTNERYSAIDGTYQKDIRPLIQATEGNGQRLNTYFTPNIPNPWGYSGVSKPQTASHILWALSGSPKGANKDSGLGQAGTDPSGIMPVHTVIVDWGRTWSRNSPSLEEWHEAIDTFGPPGTFAFPYFPPGYQPAAH